MKTNDWGYVALCLAVPLLWGLVSAKVFDWFQERRGREPESTSAASGEHDDAGMYYI